MTDVLALAGVNADLMPDEWIAVQGRPLGCRQSGCGRPAVDDRQLCREHGWWQPVVPVNMRKGIPARTYIGHDLDLSARTTPSDAWMEQASCRGSPGRDFFVDLYLARRGAEIAAAKAICSTCAVSKQCLRAGLNEAFGIWGGLTAQERRDLPSPRRQRAG